MIAPSPSPSPRRWRDAFGLYHRTGVLIVLAIIAVAAVAAAYRTHERVVDSLLESSRSVVDRALFLDAALANLDQAPPAQLLEAMSSETLHARIQPRAPDLTAGGRWRHADEVEALLGPQLAQSARERARLGFRMRTRGPKGHRDNRSERQDQTGFDRPREALIVALQQPDGQWLVVEASLARMAGPAFARTAWAASAVLMLILCVLWVSRRLQRPLDRLAAAADRFGEEIDAPPMVVHGSSEVRRATVAFNAMQSRLQAQMAERSNMLAALSHDLRTMLTRLRLRSEQPNLEPGALHGEIDKMTSMLETTLAWARGNHDAEVARSLDLAALCQTLADEQQDLGHTVRYQGPHSLPFKTRPTALQRALLNLIENAVRYGAEVEIQLTGSEEEVCIEILDWGPGIAQDDLQRAFDPFVRLDSARNQTTEGTGLGLAIVRTVLESLGGTIDLMNREGGGLIARVSLRAEPERSSGAPTQEDSPAR